MLRSNLLFLGIFLKTYRAETENFKLEITPIYITQRHRIIAEILITKSYRVK